MRSELQLVPAVAGDAAVVARLVEESGLPSADIDGALMRGFVVASYVNGSRSEAIGVCGIETRGSSGLLRSLAVAPDRRDHGIGRVLVENRLEWSRRVGLRQLYLLTLDADGYFARFGFERLSRADLPVEIRTTDEFRSLCPDTALAMSLALTPAETTRSPEV